MKRIIIFSLFAVLTSVIFGQNTQTTANYVKGTEITWLWSSQLDTISTSSSTFASNINAAPFHIWDNMDCTLYVVADSLSGSTTGSVILQEAVDPAGTNWRDIDTITVNGVQTLGTHSWQLIAPKYRVRVTAGSSTQSTKVQTEVYCKTRD